MGIGTLVHETDLHPEDRFVIRRVMVRRIRIRSVINKAGSQSPNQ